MRGRAAAQVVENDPSNVLVAALLRKRDRDADARRAADKARGADKGKRPAEPGAAERPAKRPGGAAAEAGSSRPGELVTSSADSAWRPRRLLRWFRR